MPLPFALQIHWMMMMMMMMEFEKLATVD